MVGLKDIAVLTDTVRVGENVVTVRGIGATTFVAMIDRFPELQDMLTGQKRDQIMSGLGKAVGAFIAAGTGEFGDEQAEKNANELGLALQVEFATKIMKLTFPEGIGPFVETLNRMGLIAEIGKSAEDGKAPDTK